MKRALIPVFVAYLLYIALLVGLKFAFAHEPPRSIGWPKVRAAYIADHAECEACGSTKMLDVHHVKPFHLFPDQELNPANLITLCSEPHGGCHFHIGHLRDFKAANPNVRAMAKEYREALSKRVYKAEDWPKQPLP